MLDLEVFELHRPGRQTATFAHAVDGCFQQRPTGFDLSYIRIYNK